MLTEIYENLEAIKEFASTYHLDDPRDDVWVAFNDRIDLNFWAGRVTAYPVDEKGQIITLKESVLISDDTEWKI
jgi:hypothetical protein